MRNGTLFYKAEQGRIDVLFSDGRTYGGLHCGTCFEVKNKGQYVPTRIEMSDDWFLVDTGLKGIDKLAGLKVRM